jgi:large subunit ribosomal protein L5
MAKDTSKDAGGKGGKPAGEKKSTGEKKSVGDKMPKEKKAAAAPPAEKGKAAAAPSITARMREHYKSEVVPALMSELGLANHMAVPRIKSVVLSMGVGAAKDNIKLLDVAVNEMTAIAGQKAVMTRAKKSISNFKLREGMPIGARVTLRGTRMWTFLDRLVHVALPRVRDFRGVSRKAFDGKGNYTLGLKDQLIFPEIDYGKVDLVKGMNVTIVTTAGRDDRAALLLEKLGFPFTRREA